MNGWDAALLAALAAAIGWAVRACVLAKRRGGGCSGNCAGCAGCGARRGKETS